MPGRIKALQKGKVFRYKVNRKRLDKKIRSVGTIQDPAMREAWSKKRTMNGNLFDMGLISDINSVLSIPTAKQQRLKEVKQQSGFLVEDIQETKKEKEATAQVRSKKHIVDEMERDANALRESGYRLPKGVVAFASEMITKYGLNYKAMAKDEKNYDQETWRQFRAKIRKFMCIPEQFGPFLTQSNINIEELDLNEYSTDQE